MVKREYTEVTMFLQDCRIEGKIYAMGQHAKHRIIDVINSAGKFISVIDAEAYSHRTGNEESKLLYEEPLMLINLDYVIRITLR